MLFNSVATAIVLGTSTLVSVQAAPLGARSFHVRTGGEVQAAPAGGYDYSSGQQYGGGEQPQPQEYGGEKQSQQYGGGEQPQQYGENQGSSESPSASGSGEPPKESGKAEDSGKNNSTESSGGSNDAANCGSSGDVNQEGVDAGKGAPAALYWMTNEPDGNFLMSASINQDGQLTFGDKYFAGGRGAHGKSDPVDSPDALFSQASVKVVKNTLVVANAGSNTAAMFNIDEQNPAVLKMAGGPVSSGGEFPVSSTIDKVSGNVCTLNSGEKNGVSCYKADKKLGLVAIPNSVRSLNLNQTTPPSGPANTPSQILFSDDGKKLFASVKGEPGKPGFIAAWDVQEDGSLSHEFEKNTPQAGGALPFSMTFVRGADNIAILNTDPAQGASIYDFKDGLKAQDQAVKIDGQGAACWSEFSDVTKNYYITDIMTSKLTEVSIDPKTLEAKVVKQYQQPEKSSTIDNEIITVGKRDFIYIMSPGTMSIEALELAGPGDAKPIQTFNIADAAQKVGIKVSSPNLQGVNGFFTELADA